jgi:H+/Cl- antiporter ClcA
MNDIAQLFGFAGITLIRAITADIIKDYKIKSALPKIGISMLLGVAINVILALMLDNNIWYGLGTGLIVGMCANFYNDLKEASE